MTVAELIEELRQCPQDLPVEAWDGDYQHPVPVSSVTVEDDVVNIWTERK